MSITALAGQKLAGTYTLTSLIAHGARGVVYEARHIQTGARVAIKVFYPAVLDPEALTRCRRDSDLAAALHHPGIVRVLDWSRLGERPRVYVVTEFMDGESVHARIRRLGRLSPQQALEVALRVGVVLQATHKLGVVHRGLTPRNLLHAQAPPDALEQGEILKVLDFGMAHLPALPGPGRAQEELPYRAPELAGDVSCDGRADQFSLAAILFTALTGRPPPLHDEISLDADEPVPPPPGLQVLCPEAPIYMVQAIERALSPVRNDRFASIMDFVRALDDRGLSPWRTSSSSGRMAASGRSAVSQRSAVTGRPAPSGLTPEAVLPGTGPAPSPSPSPGTAAPEPLGALPSGKVRQAPSAGTLTPVTVPSGGGRRRIVPLLGAAAAAAAAALYLVSLPPRQDAVPQENTAPLRATARVEAPQEDPQRRLAEAEAALGQGNNARAVELARAGIAVSPAQAWRVIATAACRMNDARLGEEAMGHLSEQEQAEVRRACQADRPR
jgi:serine/threonine-protein kinase